MFINTIMDSEHASLGKNVLLINKFQIFVYVRLIFAFSVWIIQSVYIYFFNYASSEEYYQSLLRIVYFLKIIMSFY